MSNWITCTIDGEGGLSHDAETALEGLELECDLASREAVFIVERELTTEEFLPEAIRLTSEMSELFPRATFALGNSPRVERRHRNSKNEIIEMLYKAVAVDLVAAEPMLERLLIERLEND